MDRKRFDALARLLAMTGSRRGAVSAVVSVALLGRHPDALADHRQGHGAATSLARGRGRASRQQRDRAATDSQGSGARHNDKGQARKRRRNRGNGHDRRQRATAQASPARCFNGSPCTPGPGANLQNCDFTGSNALKNANCRSCNAGGISLIGADASGANFSGANLGNACLIDANLTNARFNGSTNLGGAVFCRTVMPDGRVNNSGCANSTPCCSTCIAIGNSCGPGIGGSCCGGATCQNGRCACPANKPHNCNGVCQQCCGDGQCAGDTPKCCDGVCRTCCGAGDCPARECRTAACSGQGTCAYTPVADNQPGPLCPAPLVCCDGACCAARQVCDTRRADAVCCTPEPPTVTCNPPGGAPRCGMTRNDCGALVDCGPCPDVVCRTGDCHEASQTCRYRPVQDRTACEADDDAAGICCSGNCVEGNCCANANCTGNTNTCAANTCRCGTGAACTFPNSACCGASPGGACTDTNTDRNNCGGCGQRCGSRYDVCTGDPPRCCWPNGIICTYLFGGSRRCCSGFCRPAFGVPLGIGICNPR